MVNIDINFTEMMMTEGCLLMIGVVLHHQESGCRPHPWIEGHLRRLIDGHHHLIWNEDLLPTDPLPLIWCPHICEGHPGHSMAVPCHLLLEWSHQVS